MIHETETAPEPSFAVSGQHFPPGGMAELQVEVTSLRSLIHHSVEVCATESLEVAYGFFRRRQVDFMAVSRQGRVIGLCSRGHIGFILGSRFGFALYSQSPVDTALVPEPLIVRVDSLVRDVLDRAMARRGEPFHEDVVLVDSEDCLVGLIRAEAIAQLQSRLVAEQLAALQRQHAALRAQHLELFRATHAARQSQGRYLSLFETHTLGVALLDTDGGIREHNARLSELLGLAPSGAPLVSLVTWVIEAERQDFLVLLRAQAEGTPPSTREFTLRLAERGLRVFRISTGWIKETGQHCACLDDVTEQRALEQNLLRREKQNLLDTLAGGIAHELNNKLTPVHGFAELLSLHLEGEAQGHARYIQQCVVEAANIIRQLLQLSKPAQPALEAVDLRVVVEETVAILRFQLRAARCQTHFAAPPSPIWVLGDLGQLKQVALNLALNALHAIEGRPLPAITIELAAAAGWAALQIQDNGCGISRENLGRIFDPFFTTKGSERGSGLGLSVCSGIVRSHGGEIAVSSELGVGSAFTVSLPLRAAASAPEPRRPQNPAPPPAPSMRALIVDDDDIVRHLLQEMVRSQFKCQIDLAANGLEALPYVARHDYALIISDIQMPAMNGAEFFAHVRATRPHLAGKFVFITGHGGRLELESEIADGAHPIIFKPFTIKRLVEACSPIILHPAPKLVPALVR